MLFLNKINIKFFFFFINIIIIIFQIWNSISFVLFIFH